MKAFYSIIFIIIFNSGLLKAQSGPLTIGDTLSIEFITGTVPEARGKFILLDFWAVWCNPCIASFPKLDSLQNQFSEQLKIIAITRDDEKKVRRLLNKMKRNEQNGLTFISEDVVLSNIFPHKSLPHYVWISPTGRVDAITEGKDVTMKNILWWLTNNSVLLPIKKDSPKRIVSESSFFVIGNEVANGDSLKMEPLDLDMVKFHSIITNGYIEGIGGVFHFDSTRISYTNTTIKNLFKAAFSYGEWEFLSGNRVLLKVKDSSRYTVKTSGKTYIEWLKKGNGYSYELRFPEVTKTERFRIMQQDLNRYFGVLYGIEGKIEKIETKCLVLTQMTSDNKFSTQNGPTKLESNAFYLSAKNAGIEQILYILRYHFQHLKITLLNETRLISNIDIEINAKLSDLQAVNDALQVYGLQILETERKIDILVITDKKLN